MSTIRYADAALCHSPWRSLTETVIIFRSPFQLTNFLEYFYWYFQSAIFSNKDPELSLDFVVHRYKNSILVCKETPLKNGKWKSEFCLDPSVNPSLNPVDLLFDNRPAFEDAFTGGTWLSPKELAFSQERGFFRLNESS